MPSGSGGMGRGSDTRMYSPRSESTRMFGYDEDEDDIGHAHGYGDPELAAEEREKKKHKKEETKQRQKLHHLKVKHKDILEEMPDDMGEVLQESQKGQTRRSYGWRRNRDGWHYD